MSSADPFTKRELPLFPLPVVLFPGAMMPLHIFEERYKQMINDCLDGDKVFGICFHGEREEWPPTVGRIGAMAQILAVVPLDDGRMNILTSGGLRFRVTRYLDMLPYLRAEVELFQDDAEEHDSAKLVSEVKALYERASVAMKDISEDQIPVNELPETAEDFSFAIASSLQLPIEEKQSLLELRSSLSRLNRLRQSLTELVAQFEVRAEIHNRAKKNGHHGHAHLLNNLDELSKE